MEKFKIKRQKVGFRKLFSVILISAASLIRLSGASHNRYCCTDYREVQQIGPIIFIDHKIYPRRCYIHAGVESMRYIDYHVSRLTSWYRLSGWAESSDKQAYAQITLEKIESVLSEMEADKALSAPISDETGSIFSNVIWALVISPGQSVSVGLAGSIQLICQP